MKRFALLVICVTVCVGLLAAPAVASSPLDQPYRPATDAQYSWGGFWWEYSGTGGTVEESLSMWTYDPALSEDPFYKPVSNDRPILHCGITLGVGRGLLEHFPNILRFSFDIAGVEGEAEGYSAHYGPRETKAHWTRPFVWDEFWVKWFTYMFMYGEEDWVPSPFNPSIGAKIYGTLLQFPLFPLEGPDGEAAEPPRPGTYHVAVSVRQALPWNEMLYGGDPSLPTHAPAGSYIEDYEFDMVVAD
jgi:hypothetical protein